MPKFKVGDIIKAKRGSKKRLIVGTEQLPDGSKIWYNYYDGALDANNNRIDDIKISTMGRCLEATMTSWGNKI